MAETTLWQTQDGDPVALPTAQMSESWWLSLKDPPLVEPGVISEVLPGVLYQSGRIERWHDILRQEPGVNVVIDLSGESGDEPRDFPGEPIFQYMHWPIKDVNSPNAPADVSGPHLPPRPMLQALADYIGRLIDAGCVVLVACKSGRNRSSLVLAHVLMSYLRYSGKDAVSWLQERRLGVFSNAVFKRAVEVLE